MRKLFIVLVKVGGLFVVLFYFLATFSFLMAVVSYAEHGLKMLYAALGCIFMVLSVGYLLLFKTERLADWLHVPDGDISKSIDYDKLLSIGIKLLGLYYTVFGLVSFLRWSVNLHVMEIKEVVGDRFTLLYLPALLKFVLGGVLAFGSDFVVRLISAAKQTSAKNVAAIFFVILLVLFVASGMVVRFSVRHRSPKAHVSMSMVPIQDSRSISYKLHSATNAVDASLWISGTTAGSPVIVSAPELAGSNDAARLTIPVPVGR
jgi:hypothetical protein